MKNTLRKVPHGQQFIPYRDKESHPKHALVEDVRVTLGRGIDERTIGWLIPEPSNVSQDQLARNEER